jgi:hypothetical protein
MEAIVGSRFIWVRVRKLPEKMLMTLVWLKFGVNTVHTSKSCSPYCFKCSLWSAFGFLGACASALDMDSLVRLVKIRVSRWRSSLWTKHLGQGCSDLEFRIASQAASSSKSMDLVRTPGYVMRIIPSPNFTASPLCEHFFRAASTRWQTSRYIIRLSRSYSALPELFKVLGSTWRRASG